MSESKPEKSGDHAAGPEACEEALTAVCGQVAILNPGWPVHRVEAKAAELLASSPRIAHFACRVADGMDWERGRLADRVRAALAGERDEPYQVGYDSEETGEAFSEWLAVAEMEPAGTDEYVLMRMSFTAGMNEILARIDEWKDVAG